MESGRMKNDEKILGNTIKTDQSLFNRDGEMKTLGEIMLDLAAIITKWRRFIVRFVLLATIVTTVIAFLSPKWYKATARVFPAEQTNLFPGLEGASSLSRTFGLGGAFRGLQGNSEIERYLAILKSESALMKVIERFDLTRVYEITSYPRMQTIRVLLSNTEFEEEDEGDLLIAVYDKDPQRAADMTNYFVQVLNETNSQMQAQNAHANREFIEQRIQKCQLDLHNAEEQLKEFQKDKGILMYHSKQVPVFQQQRSFMP